MSRNSFDFLGLDPVGLAIVLFCFMIGYCIGVIFFSNHDEQKAPEKEKPAVVQVEGEAKT